METWCWAAVGFADSKAWSVGVKRKQLCIVLVTVRSRKEGRAIAGMLLKRKLAACVNLLPLVESHFWWNGKIDRASECLLVIKSIRSHFRQLAATVRLHHSYQKCD